MSPFPLSLPSAKERYVAAQTRIEARAVVERLIMEQRHSLGDIADELSLGLEQKKGAAILHVREELDKRFGPSPIPEEQEAKEAREIVKKEIEKETPTTIETFPNAERLEECLVPPDEQETRHGEGPWEEPKTFPRTRLAFEVLESLGLKSSDTQIFSGSVDPRMFRKLGYNAIVVNKLDRLILVCDEEANRTFVAYSAKNPEKYWRMTKGQLKSLIPTGQVSDLEWDDGEVWKSKLAEKIIAKPKIVGPIVPTPVPPTELMAKTEKATFAPRDKAYYLDPAKVKHDLEAYAAKLGEGKVPAELNTGTIFYTPPAVCANGEEVRGIKWLNNATVALGLAEDWRAAEGKQAETLALLFKTAGIETRDGDYYRNPEKVKHDLEAYAAKLGEGKVPAELHTGNMQSIPAVCANGERVKGKKWLNNAAVALGLAEDSHDADGKLAETLALLFKTAGIETRDGDYYRNPEKVKHDLEAYAAKLGEGKVPAELHTGNMQSIPAVCANGEEMRGRTWLRHAAVALGLAKDSTDAGDKLAETLALLFRTAGIETRDGDYYRNPEKVKHDLEAYAAKLGEGKVPAELNTGNMQSIPAVCANGEEVRGGTWLINAAVALGLAEDTHDTSGKLAKTLKKLKEIAGVKG